MTLSCLTFAPVIGASFGVAADQGYRDDMERVIQLAVAGAGETVSLHVSGRDLDGRDTAVRGEGSGRAESTDAAGVSQDLRGGHGADAVDAGQLGAGGLDCCMRRSSLTSSTASCRTVRPSGSRGRTERSNVQSPTPVHCGAGGSLCGVLPWRKVPRSRRDQSQGGWVRGWFRFAELRRYLELPNWQQLWVDVRMEGLQEDLLALN